MQGKALHIEEKSVVLQHPFPYTPHVHVVLKSYNVWTDLTRLCITGCCNGSNECSVVLPYMYMYMYMYFYEYLSNCAMFGPHVIRQWSGIELKIHCYRCNIQGCIMWLITLTCYYLHVWHPWGFLIATASATVSRWVSTIADKLQTDAHTYKQNTGTK